jgi:prophage tail gpP-like protein
MISDSADSDSVELGIIDTGERVSFHTGYSYSKEFLAPSDSWQFSTGDAVVVERLRSVLLPGTRVRLFINDKPQSTGRVDSIHVTATARAGHVMTVTGRDTMGLVVDSCVDPNLSFGPSTTLLDALFAIFAPFGFRIFATSDIVNRQIVSGNDPKNTRLRTEVVKTSKSLDPTVAKDGAVVSSGSTVGASAGVTQAYDPTRPRFLKDIKLDQVKPRVGEGSYELAARLCKRFGLHLWVDALGETVIVGEPEFDQRAAYAIGAPGSYIDVDYGTDWTAQPSVIIATGRSGGGAFAKSKLVVAMVNELTGCDELGRIRPDVRAAISKFKSAVVLPIRPQLVEYGARFREGFARPVYLEDGDSQTIGQLEGFVRREMGARQSRALQVTYTVEGHTQAGSPWALNSIVDVDDDAIDVHSPMWLRARQFTKSATGGTLTRLTLAVPYTIEI